MCNNLAIISKEGNFDALVAKFKVGLLLGRSKGEKGTGFYHNGRVVKSEDGKSSYYDNHDSLKFMVEAQAWFYPGDMYNVFMGHNRAPSTGMGKGGGFVHPFVYGTETGERTIFQHNGTVKNTDELCTLFGIEFKDFNNDSKLLGHLIHKGVDPHEIFKAYRGACTCIWFDEKSDTLNIFKGGSETAYGKVEAERDLYYYKTDTSYIFNTQEEILRVINDWDDDVEMIDFPINTVVTITKDLEWSEDVVNRVVPFIHPPKRKTKVIPFTGRGGNNLIGQGNGYIATPVMYIDSRFTRFHVTWFKGLYYYNKRLIHGRRKFNAQGRSDVLGQEYYFFQGAMVKNKDCFDKCVQRGFVDNNWFHKKALSKYTTAKGEAWMYGGRSVSTKIVKDCLFCTAKIGLHKGRIVKGDIVNPDYKVGFNAGLIDREAAVKNYNTFFGTEFDFFVGCEKDFCERFGLTYTSSTYYPNPLVTIGNNVTEDMEIDYIDDYNQIMDTKFVTICQCQNHYFALNKITDTDDNVINFYEGLDEYAYTGDMTKPKVTIESLINSQF